MPVDKQILNQYIDACELVKETEQDIETDYPEWCPGYDMFRASHVKKIRKS